MSRSPKVARGPQPRKAVASREVLPVRGTFAQFKKNMIKFWTTSLLVPQAPGELIGLCAKPRNARQVMGIDIYEVQLLCHNFNVTLVFELHAAFEKNRDAFVKFMESYFHPQQLTTILAQLDRITEAMKTDREFAEAVKHEEQKLIDKQKAERKAVAEAERAAQAAEEAAKREEEEIRKFEEEEKAREAARAAGIDFRNKPGKNTKKGSNNNNKVRKNGKSKKGSSAATLPNGPTSSSSSSSSAASASAGDSQPETASSTTKLPPTGPSTNVGSRPGSSSSLQNTRSRPNSSRPSSRRQSLPGAVRSRPTSRQQRVRSGSGSRGLGGDLDPLQPAVSRRSSASSSSSSRRPPMPKQKPVGPGKGLAAPTPVKIPSKNRSSSFANSVSGAQVPYSDEVPEEDNGRRLQLPMLVSLHPDDDEAALADAAVAAAAAAASVDGDATSSSLELEEGSRPGPTSRNGSRQHPASAGADRGPADANASKSGGISSSTKSTGNALLQPSSFDNAEAPEYDIDAYLAESDAGVEVSGIAEARQTTEFQQLKAERFRTKDLRAYFVHDEVDKQTELDLNHFSLGEDETNMLYGYLEDNKEIRSVCLQGNRIGPRCAPFLAKLITHNRSITKLDLSTNCIGAGAAALAEALKTTRTLHWLSLRGNQIRAAARQLADGLRLNRSLKALDLSCVNQRRDCLKSAMPRLPQKTLKELHLGWNSMGAYSGEALGQLLKFNKSIMSLNVAWNNLCTDGTIGLAEGLAQNAKLQFLDVSSNRIDFSAVTILADAISLNRTLKNVQINNNPLGTSGTHLLFAASEVNTSLQHLGINRVAAPPHTQRVAPELHYFDTHRLSGHYILNLEVRWDHAIAELLRVRVALKQGQIFRMVYNEEPLVVDFNTYLVPLEGELSFDFLSNEMLQKANLRVSEHHDAPSSVHYRLDLSQSDDRDVYASLCKQARAQAGENFINEQLNGKPFEFQEELPKDPTEKLTRGIIELDFVTTRLSHEARYQFNLKDPIQRAKATKMLERVYLAKVSAPSAVLAGAEDDDEEEAGPGGEFAGGGGSGAGKGHSEEQKLGTIGSAHGGGDQWTNVTVDGKKVNVHEWRVNIDSKGAFKWREDIDSSGVAETLKETWRVPTKGVLEFDLITSNPMYMFSDHYRLNLANVKDRQLAESLRVTAALQPGENWWNETLNGYRFDLQEIVSGDSNRLPNRGILEFDIVMLAPQRGNLAMKQDHYIFDLEDPVEYECVTLMRKRIMKYRLSQEEFWMHVRFNDQVIPASMVWRAMWQIPQVGVLELDYVTFETERRDMPRNTFKLLVIALKAVNDREKFYLLQSQGAGPDPYHMTIQQVRKLLNLFARGTVEQRMALEVLLGMIRHPHQALHLLESVVPRDQNALKYWALHGKWMT